MVQEIGMNGGNGNPAKLIRLTLHSATKVTEYIARIATRRFYLMHATVPEHQRVPADTQ